MILSGDIGRRSTPARNAKAILLVEDESEDFELLELACRRAGLTVEWLHAQDRRMAESLIGDIADGSRDVPGLAIIDLRLPDGSGLDLLPHLAEALPELPVVVFSTGTAPINLADLFADGRGIFFNKPYDFAGYAEIIDHIRLHLV